MTFIRYILVQLLAYGIDLGSFLFLFDIVQTNAVLANVFAKVIAGVLAFATHHYFTFRLESRPALGQAVAYTTLLALNIPISTGLFVLILHFMPVNELPAKIISDILCVGISYTLSKFLVFRRSKHPAETSR